MEQFKARLGQTIISLNEDVLLLQKSYRSLKEAESNSKKKESVIKSTDEIEGRVKEKKKILENAQTYLTENPDSMDEKRYNKYIKLLTTTLKTTEQCLELRDGADENIEETLDKTVVEIKDTLKEENESAKSLDDIIKQLPEIPKDKKKEEGLSVDLNVSEDKEEQGEFSCLQPFEQDRFNRKVYDI